MPEHDVLEVSVGGHRLQEVVLRRRNSMDCSVKKGAVVEWTWGLGQFRVTSRVPLKARKRKGLRTMVELSDEQKVSFTVNPRTQGGNPAPVHGDVLYTLTPDDGSAVVLTIDEASPNKRAGFVTAVAGEGVRPWSLVAKFDADLGDGIREITAVGDGLVKDAEAVVSTVDFGTPEQA